MQGPSVYKYSSSASLYIEQLSLRRGVFNMMQNDGDTTGSSYLVCYEHEIMYRLVNARFIRNRSTLSIVYTDDILKNIMFGRATPNCHPVAPEGVFHYCTQKSAANTVVEHRP